MRGGASEAREGDRDTIGTVAAEVKVLQSLVEELSQTMVDASICGLGQAAPNPVRCVIKYFPDEIK